MVQYLHGSRSQSCPSLSLPTHMEEVRLADEGRSASAAASHMPIAIHVSVTTTHSMDDESIASCENDSEGTTVKAEEISMITVAQRQGCDLKQCEVRRAAVFVQIVIVG